MPVRLIATAEYPYAGVSLAKGDTFEASAKDAHLLKLVGRAVDAPVDPVGTYQTRDLEPVGAGTVPRAKRRYRRRDLAKGRD